MANEHLQWVARGVFQTTEGAPIANGGGIDSHLQDVIGQLPTQVPADAEAVQEQQHKAPQEDVEPVVVETVAEAEAAEATDADVGEEAKEETVIQVTEAITPSLAAEVFGELKVEEPVKTAKKPAKKKPSSK